MSWYYRILRGDSRRTLHDVEDGSVQAGVTSPPYLGKRDYETGTWLGGSPECDHMQKRIVTKSSGLRKDGRRKAGGYDNEKGVHIGMPYRDICGKCGARRQDTQIGLEVRVEEYVAALTEVFSLLAQKLHPTGTQWIVLGDGHAGYWGDSGARKRGERPASDTNGYTNGFSQNLRPSFHQAFDGTGIKPKDLIGIPWEVARAIRNAGLWIRQEIIWEKPNAKPESVVDRPTTCHETIFLVSRRPEYYYDSHAVREPAVTGLSTTRNCRTIWRFYTEGFNAADVGITDTEHYAPFPPSLVRRCIEASTPDYGCCPHCLTPWGRVVERFGCNGKGTMNSMARYMELTTKWRPLCKCDRPYPTVPAVVIDPFAGTGTTGEVALSMGRRVILGELNGKYQRICEARCLRAMGFQFALPPSEIWEPSIPPGLEPYIEDVPGSAMQASMAFEDE